MRIIDTRAIEILDSRGNPTVRTYVTLDDNTHVYASVPSGASTGSHEAVELRDGGDRYQGKGVRGAVNNVNTIIAHELKGRDISKLDHIDQHLITLDGSKDKSVLGANAILSVSLACARAYAKHRNLPLWRALNDYYFSSTVPHFPRLMVNVINGGAHANWTLDIQECMIIPRDTQPSSSVEIAANIFHTLGGMLHKRKLATAVGDEGGFAPALKTNDAAFGLIEEAILEAGYTRAQVDIGTDIAASELYDNGSYRLTKHPEGKVTLSAAKLRTYYAQLIRTYGIHSIEDPFHEDDWEAFIAFTKLYGSSLSIVGDDFFVTQKQRIVEGITKKAANAVLVKVNQVGTVYETALAIKQAKKAGWRVAISHRSGETEDTFISDLAFACAATYIKAGSMSRSERLSKYNRLMEIEKLEY